MAEYAGPAHDVFISYASPDITVAEAVCAALERDGVRCWIAPRDVLPGSFYADAIVHAIDAAKTIVLVLSQNSASSDHVLREVERASSKRHPVISLRIDLAPLPSGLEYFLNTSQWLDASGQDPGAALPKLVAAVCRVISKDRTADPWVASGHPGAPITSGTAPALAARRSRQPAPALIAGAIVAVTATVFGLHYLLASRATHPIAPPATPAAPAELGTPAAGTAGPASAAFSPPPHSVAVLPFVNMSGDPKQDYFSDGLSEELLNSLTSVRDLQVAARTSSFYFKGKEVDLAEIAHKLNVSALLEGSVRKDGQHVRITAQLINAITGFHLWSQTYDRDLKDVLKLQTEIATSVTKALQAALLSNAVTSTDVGGTQNPQALDAYLRGKNLQRDAASSGTLLSAIAAYKDAVRFDPAFAKAWSASAIADVGYAQYYGTVEQDIRAHFETGRTAAERAVALAPTLGQAHLALAQALASGYLDYAGALAEFQKALAVAPNDAELLAEAGDFYVNIGRTDEGLKLVRRAATLDQMNPRTWRTLSNTLTSARQYREAIAAANSNISVSPNDSRGYAIRGLAQLLMGETPDGVQSCEHSPRDWANFLCLAVGYEQLHRHSDAQSQVDVMTSEYHDATAYQFAEIYAQWGNSGRAFEWLETARRLRDPGLINLKVDPLLDPLRGQAGFQATLAALKFPG